MVYCVGVEDRWKMKSIAFCTNLKEKLRFFWIRGGWLRVEKGRFGGGEW